ncbi:unnamed protein product [Schistosoma mattheei]|uniref:Uncharacterized protein n=1 Tax=Schistosoma mattheei TaxID=31246 RepID=A0A183PVR6_9TREM|nr:unnamed protein product [Schistosoma mattheei]
MKGRIAKIKENIQLKTTVRQPTSKLHSSIQTSKHFQFTEFQLPELPQQGTCIHKQSSTQDTQHLLTA